MAQPLDFKLMGTVPIFHSTLRTQIFKNSLGILLTNFNKKRNLPKDAVNPKWQNDQKNSCRIGQMAIPNLKRSGFVKIPLNFSLSRNEQNKVPLFF